MASNDRRGWGRVAARALPLPFAVPFGRFSEPLSWDKLVGWWRACLDVEIGRRRLFPWLAVAYGLGILLAFAADGPVSLAPPFTAATIFAGLAFAFRARLWPMALCLFVTFVFAGFAVAIWRMGSVDAPILARATVGRVEGFVRSIEVRQRGGRLVLDVTALGALASKARPERVRVSARDLGGALPGQYIRASARLLPPPEAARPNGYDFGRDSFFAGIGAVGSISGKPAIIADPPEPAPFGLRIAAAIDRARNTVTARITTAIGGQAGAVAAALITGKRGFIDDHSNDILRAAGIYHIVSISGLHMVLAAGFFFWGARALLALSSHAALHWPIKKIAALAGMAGATAYDIFSGSDVATERSLFMILVMQGAILFDRPALSLRNLAISGLIVLTREPETVLGPSLQMSYAAVAGLIALAEWQRGRRKPPPEDRLARWTGRAVATLVTIIATTTVASLATGPFSTFHFQNLQPYGVIGNAAAVPLIEFVAMPCAVIGLAAFPFGLDRPIWILMGWAVDAMLRLSEWVAGLSGSVTIVPAFGTGALVLFVCALLLATVPASSLRLLAAIPACLGVALAAASPRADLYVARDGAAAAVRARDGRLVTLGRVSAFVAEQWLHADGDARRAADAIPAASGESARCDPRGCVARSRAGPVIALVLDRRAFESDCGRADIVVSRFAAPADCAARLVLDRDALATKGAVSVRFTETGLDVTAARDANDARPWLRHKSDPGAKPRENTRALPSVDTRAQPSPPAGNDGEDATTPDGDEP